MDSNYFEERDNRNTVKLRNVVNELPDFVWEFFVGIQMRTSVLTRLNYAYDLRIFFDYLIKTKYKTLTDAREIVLPDIERLKAFDIELFLEYLSSYEFCGKKYKCGESAKERKLSTLRSFFGYYFKKDKLSCNIAAKVDMPKLHDKNITKLESGEVNELMYAVDSGVNLTKQQNNFHRKTHKRDVAIVTLFLGTGIRISECVGLNRNDVDLDKKSFIVTRKGGNKSILYFNQDVAIALRDYLDWLENQKTEHTDFANKITDESPLFFSLQGKRISVRAVEQLVKKYCRPVTPLKKITPHKLRSTFGTELYKETQDIYVVAEILGHKDINTTKKHYADMSEEIRKKASTTKLYREDDDKEV